MKTSDLQAMTLSELQKLFDEGVLHVHKAVNPDCVLISSIHEEDHIAIDFTGVSRDE